MPELALTVGQALAEAEAAAARGDHLVAASLCDRLLVVDPGLLRARYLGALSLQRLQRLEAAEAAYLDLLARAPDAAEAHGNLALVRRAAGRTDAALPSFRRALALAPDDIVAWYNLGNLLTAAGALEAALGAYARALAIDPDNAEAEWARAEPLMVLGRLAEGHRAMEARWRDPRYPWGRRRSRRTPWDGTAFPGRTLLVHDEQGFGDTLFYSRWASALALAAAGWGGRVALEVHPPLAGLLRSLPGVAEVVPRGAPPPPHELHVPLLSLPHVARLAEPSRADDGLVRLDPPPVPFLRASPRRPLDRPAGGLAVGLAWAANPAHPTGRQRSVPPELLRRLLDVPGVAFYSLQVGADADLGWSDGRVVDLAPEIGDFVDTACLIAALDLVVAVDSAVAHVAGAMAREVWVMLDDRPSWRWAGSGADSPWYPSARLFRQGSAGAWIDVVAPLAAALRRRTAGPPAAT